MFVSKGRWRNIQQGRKLARALFNQEQRSVAASNQIPPIGRFFIPHEKILSMTPPPTMREIILMRTPQPFSKRHIIHTQKFPTATVRK